MQAGLGPEPIPQDILSSIAQHGGALIELCLDWWEISTGELERFLRSMANLKKLQISIKASVLRLVGADRLDSRSLADRFEYRIQWTE